ncbi:PEP-CTERM sorting domain-containing protein [Verrucomicrobiaceae bacterium 227]
MNSPAPAQLIGLGLLTAITCQSSQAATILYLEDFSSPNRANTTVPYLGGWYGNEIDFGDVVGPSNHVSITVTETLGLSNDTTSYRSAAIVIDPAVFTSGAGTYTLKYDITAYNGDSNDQADIRVWQGSGYDFNPPSSGNALIVDTQQGALIPQLSAAANQVASDIRTTTGTDFTVNFNYDGVSAVGIFLGSTNTGGTQPRIEFDNIRIEAPDSIPEPSSAILALLATGLILVRRR